MNRAEAEDIFRQENKRLREALHTIWCLAPLPTKTDEEKIKEIHEIARRGLFPR